MKPGETYSVGCNDDASLTLTDPMVLKHHCSIECEADTVILRNHTASAGTYVGDKKISQARVRPGVTFRVGDSHLKLTARIAAQTLKPALQG
ncbi:MAG: FHA domain-containing protein, partial [Planctomycetota bacterium]|nr:FHA domain-containing protein [Planctomycetota bacterium]